MTDPATRDLERELGGLALSAARAHDPMDLVRAAHLRNDLARVGVTPPLWLAHDLAALARREPTAFGVHPSPAVPLPEALDGRRRAWVETVRELGESETFAEARRTGLRDDLVTVLLLRVLDAAFPDGLARGGHDAPLPLDPTRYRQSPATLEARLRAHDRRGDAAYLDRVVGARVRLVMAVEHVDLETLRLLGLFGPEASAGGAASLVDLLEVMRSAEASDVVGFAMDLLPSLLETRRASGEQIFSVDGYAGIERRGTLDSLVLTELAFDPELFDRRYVDRELFYYAREKQHEEERRLHYVLIDATASMRGLRATFARGLALALVKKLLLRGEEVWYRFFDSRLYDLHRAGGRRRGGAGIDVPYLLSFRGERGRNYAKVFGLLANELERVGRRREGTPMLYLLTHAECHIPPDTVDRLRQVARLYGVFLMPSTGALDLEWTGKLHGAQIVDGAALGRREARARRALSIVEDVAGEGRG